MKSIAPLIIILLFSCKHENLNDRSPGLIQVAISDIAFESEETLGNRAATHDENTIQRNTIELNKDFLMVAELHPEDPASTSLKDGTRAVMDTAALGTNVRYRVLVYSQTGEFVTERDYIRSQESNTSALQLDGGSTYTFVVVSLNRTDELPATTPALATRNLANSQISTPNTGVNALMYYQHTMTVTGNSINRLDIVLKHRKPLIGVTINASQTGYNITDAQGRFDPHNNGMLVNLSDGSHTQTGANIGVQVNFNSLGSQTVVNTSTNYINSPSNNITSFTLPSITIGDITMTNLVPFTNLTVTPGVRYNLILNIVPNDRYITHQGRPAAIINGTIWALHNVGVDPLLDRNPSTVTSAYHGNYYQFGKIAITAGPTATTTNSNFTTTTPGTAWWNVGTEAAPIKTTADPCPAGFRVPTRTEAQRLLDGVNVTYRGSFTDSNTNFGSAAILTSKRNANVVLVLPTQGFQNVSTGNPPSSVGLENRGNTANYWTSTATGGDVTPFRLLVSSATTIVSQPTGGNNFAQSRTIRCAALL